MSRNEAGSNEPIQSPVFTRHEQASAYEDLDGFYNGMSMADINHTKMMLYKTGLLAMLHPDEPMDIDMAETLYHEIDRLCMVLDALYTVFSPEGDQE